MTDLKLNLGCGKDIREGWVNIDWKPGPGVNLVHDLRDPLPFPSESVAEVRAFDVLEHLADWEHTFMEILRVLVPGGKVTAHVPYGLDDNATFHRRYFTEQTFDGFIVDSVDFFGKNATTLEGVPATRLIRRTVERRPVYPFAWHLKKFLGIPYLGPKHAIYIKLEKLKEADRDG